MHAGPLTPTEGSMSTGGNHELHFPASGDIIRMYLIVYRAECGSSR